MSAARKFLGIAVAVIILFCYPTLLSVLTSTGLTGFELILFMMLPFAMMIVALYIGFRSDD